MDAVNFNTTQLLVGFSNAHAQTIRIRVRDGVTEVRLPGLDWVPMVGGGEEVHIEIKSSGGSGTDMLMKACKAHVVEL